MTLQEDMPNKHTPTLTLVALLSQDTPGNPRKKGKIWYFYRCELIKILKCIVINPIFR